MRRVTSTAMDRGTTTGRILIIMAKYRKVIIPTSTASMALIHISTQKEVVIHILMTTHMVRVMKKAAAMIMITMKSMATTMAILMDTVILMAKIKRKRSLLKFSLKMSSIDRHQIDSSFILQL